MAGTLKIDTLQEGSGASIPVDTVINGSAKAWVQFNGTSGVIRKSFNVSSVTRNAVGDYTVNLTTPLTDTNYSVAQTPGGSSGVTGTRGYEDGTGRTTSVYRLVTNSGSSTADAAYISVTFFD